jgi:hypothetical protein
MTDDEREHWLLIERYKYAVSQLPPLHPVRLRSIVLSELIIFMRNRFWLLILGIIVIAMLVISSVIPGPVNSILQVGAGVIIGGAAVLFLVKPFIS